MFGLLMAILFATAFIVNGTMRYVDAHNDKKLAEKTGRDYYHDINGVQTHIDDGLPFVYREINGEVYEINPYNYKIRRNITKERSAAKLSVFRKIANKNGVRFVEDITADGKNVYYDHMYNRNRTTEPCYRHIHLNNLKSFNYAPNENVGLHPVVDTVTGYVYLSYKRKFDRNEEYIPYLMNPSTGFVECVNIDQLDTDKEYKIITKNGTEIYARPTDELINNELEIINKPINSYYVSEVKKNISNNKMENDVKKLEAMIGEEIKLNREKGENYL